MLTSAKSVLNYLTATLTNTAKQLSQDTKLCLRTLNEACPYCEEASRLRKKKKDLEKEHRSMNIVSPTEAEKG